MNRVGVKLSQNIKDYLEDSKMTQTQLADKAGIAQTTLSNIVNGQVSPNIETVSKLAIAIGVGTHDLLMDEEDEKYFKNIFL